MRSGGRGSGRNRSVIGFAGRLSTVLAPARNRPGRAARLTALCLAALVPLGGCAYIPSSGPSASEIIKATQDTHAAFPFDIIDIAGPSAPSAAEPSGSARLSGLAAAYDPAQRGRIGPGDVLQVSVFEVGAGLFASHTTTEGPGASVQPMPMVAVDASGMIALPYLGQIAAAGLTPNELAARIQAGLARHSQAPEVVVSVHDNIANTAVVLGDVKRPGRIMLTLAGERVLDAIAEAGGVTNPSSDNVVTLVRGTVRATTPMAGLTAGSADDVELQPRDRVEVDYRPRTFTVYGATGKVQELPFINPRVSLAEALARTGGPSDAQADPSAVFVFRYEPSAYDGAPQPGSRPVAYRLNLAQAQSYFLAQRFEMKSRDLIYVANASSNQPAKLLQILNLFFQPFYSGKVISQ